MAKHIGIIAVSPEGSALCYRSIYRHATRLVGEHLHPTISMHNEPLELYISAVMRDDWHAVGELLHRSAKILAAAGAEFCIVADNLMQFGVHLAEVGSPIPFLAMTDLVAEAVAKDGRKTVGLIGTKPVMFGSAYQTSLGLRGITVLVPEETQGDLIDAIIFKELLFGVAKPESQKTFVQIIDSLSHRGCEGVLLGYSEAPLLLANTTSPLPIYDPMDLLAEGAVKVSIGERPLAPRSAPNSPMIG